MANGRNSEMCYNSSDNINPKYVTLPNDLNFDGTDDIQYAATIANINTVFNTLQQKITNKDNVFILSRIMAMSIPH